MTTIERLASINVSIDFALPVECLSVDDFSSMPHDVLMDIWAEMGRLMDSRKATREQEALYWEIDAYEQDRYYYDHIEAFREFESHKDEPDFDWDFYSDWHKDMFGYRPR